MPELPEVETIRHGLSSKLINKTITGVDVFWPPTVGGNAKLFSQQILNQRIQDISRHGKKIYWQFPETSISFHLRMTGQLLFVPRLTKPGKFTRVIFNFKDENENIHFDDIRKFGRIKIEPVKNLSAPDAWLASTEDIYRVLRKKKGMVKHTLLNQRLIAGLGNIYVDEILFKTKIHPLKNLEKISATKIHELIKNMKAILKKSIQIGGTSFRNYVDTQGTRGGYKNWLHVYGKAGARCFCGGIIKKIVVAQRGTHFCPRCQKIQKTSL